MEITRQRLVETNTIILEYLDETSVDASAVSELLQMDLIAPSREQRYTGYFASGELDGTATIIQIIGLAADCKSEDWNLKILTVNDPTMVDTVYEVVSYEEIDKSFSDFTFTNFFVDNRDTPVTNRLYAQITNNGTIPTGDIRISLFYRPM